MPAFSVAPDAPPGGPARASGPGGLVIPAEVGGCLKRALRLIQEGKGLEAADWVAAAAVADIQKHNLAFLATAVGAGFIADVYGRCLTAEGLGVAPWRAPEGARGRPSDGGHALYVLPALAPGMAAAQRLLRLLESRPAGGGRVSVLVAEEFTRRKPECRAVGWPEAPSSEIGAALVARLRAAGIDPVILPTEGSYADGARAGVRVARELAADAAMFIASPACPVQAGMAMARVAPLQVVQNIGAPLLTRGVDRVVYHNPRTFEVDQPELARRGIGGVLAPSVGTDARAGLEAVALPRRALGLPERPSRVVVCAGNKLPERMLAGTFAADLGKFLGRHPDVWWLGIGRGDLGPALAIVEREGGADARRRCVLTGALEDIRPAVKACDVFLSEYPEGGCNTVLESMACGVPAVALRPSGVAGHTASVAATLLDDGEGSGCATVGAYWGRVALLVSDGAAHAAESRRQLERVREKFSDEATRTVYERSMTPGGFAA
ncbi:MAG: glycosyltransferase [Planctomycetota bacterium]|nr:glycosyltransferase [Planctomycetota bacterium]